MTPRVEIREAGHQRKRKLIKRPIAHKVHFFKNNGRWTFSFPAYVHYGFESDFRECKDWVSTRNAKH